MLKHKHLWMTIVVSLVLLSKGAAQEFIPTAAERLERDPDDMSASPLAAGDVAGSGFSGDENVFRRGAQELGCGLGAGLGMAVFGTEREHDWTIGAVQYGRMLSGPVATDHWYRGNWELMGELFGGQQFHPSAAYYVGIAPLLRYNFAAGRRLVPFADAGAGISATDIRDGDLSTTYEFNLQAGVGLRFFLSDRVAFTAQSRLIHLSNASTHAPNLGVNNVSLLAGITCFF